MHEEIKQKCSGFLRIFSLKHAYVSAWFTYRSSVNMPHDFVWKRKKLSNETKRNFQGIFNPVVSEQNHFTLSVITISDRHDNNPYKTLNHWLT